MRRSLAGVFTHSDALVLILQHILTPKPHSNYEGPSLKLFVPVRVWYEAA